MGRKLEFDVFSYHLASPLPPFKIHIFSSHCPCPSLSQTPISPHSVSFSRKESEPAWFRCLKHQGPLATSPVFPHFPSSNILFPSRDQLITLMNTPYFSIASRCFQEKGGRQNEHRRNTEIPAHAGDSTMQRGSLDHCSRGTQTKILFLDLFPDPNPSLGFRADAWVFGSDHCLVTFQRVQEMILNTWPQRGSLAKEICQRPTRLLN